MQIMKKIIIKPSKSALPTESESEQRLKRGLCPLCKPFNASFQDSEAKKELLAPFPQGRGLGDGVYKINKTFMENCNVK